ncbi:MAG: DEAD/DEAH box helicase [Alphaproteobacteria bacterium]|nr:DEAD/DEAH box helicase [Alphaproteobacteria bacterium]
MENFSELNLPEQLLRSLEKMQFTTPTPIQAQAIPMALQGRDILGSAQTGTGKTAAFGIPLITHLIKNQTSTAIVMTPTRELAVQVMQTLKKLIGGNTPIKAALLIGGENMFRQFSQLEARPRLIVGTPGRINDHLTRKSLRLEQADFLVLDETDRMLDMGFGVQIDKVLSFMPRERQTLMFSATMPAHIVAMSNKYMKQPLRIAVGSTSAPIKAIKQSIIRMTQGEKYGALTQQLDARGGSIIVFVRTKHGADRLAHKLGRENHSAGTIHGDLRQNKRDKVIRQFREKEIRILVATDVAARGLDIPHIEHVINYDLPQCPEDYIHRIGRTARAGAEGEALCLVTPEENGKWAAIERLMNNGESSPDNYSRAGQRPQKPGNRNNRGQQDRRRSGPGAPGKEGFNGQRRTKKPYRKTQAAA